MNGITSVHQLRAGMAAPLNAADPTASSVSIPSAQLRELNASQPGAAASVQPASGSFASLLDRTVQEVNAKQNAATQAVHDLQTGQNVSLHDAMIATEEANISFQLMVQTRNRLLEAYQELMRMSV
jgi:flagellar hook-basal body complex protein FliE